MVGWAFFEAWWAHFANGYAAYQRFLVDHLFKMTLAGYISSAEATLLLNKKHHLQLMSIQYGKLRGFDDLNLLGSCPGDCKHDEVGLDGVQVGFRRSQYTCTQPWILNKVCISGLPGLLDLRAPKAIRAIFKTLSSSDYFVYKTHKWEVSKNGISLDDNNNLSEWLDSGEAPFSAKLSGLFTIFPLVTIGETLHAPEPLRNVLGHFSSTYPTISLCPRLCCDGFINYYATGGWEQRSLTLCAGRAPALLNLIRTGIAIEQENKNSNAQKAVEDFIVFLCKFVKSFDSVLATVATPYHHSPGISTETGYRYPKHPVLRCIADNYSVDLKNKKGPCPKYASATTNFMPGLMCVFCLKHSNLIGFHLMHHHESPKTAFELFYTRWPQGPRVICYDNACNLSRSVSKKNSRIATLRPQLPFFTLENWMFHLTVFLIANIKKPQQNEEELSSDEEDRT